MTTTLAHKRFLPPIAALNAILSAVSNQKDTGLAFYNKKARDILFQLEGLCRVYRSVQDKKFFERWYKEFKFMEDLLGRMDYHESLWNEFSTFKELKKQAEKNFLENFKHESQQVSDKLHSDGWLSGAKMKSFEDDLTMLKWKTDDQDVIAFGNAMCNEFDKLVDKYRNGELDMDHLESGLHEFRRKLRWISIYAQISNGLVQLKSITTVPAGLVKYCTGEIVKSPFNVLTKPTKGQKTVVIQSHYFYAMSWLIRYLSELKDTGLSNEAFLKLCSDARIKDRKLIQKFTDSCKFDPSDVSTLAEAAIDDFIYADIIPERICRDIMRSLQ